MKTNSKRLAAGVAAGALGLGFSLGGAAVAAERFCPKGTNPDPAVIWCDSFEQEDKGPKGTVEEKYFEFNSADGDFVPVTMATVHGSRALRAHWDAGQVSAGHFILNFGRNPLRSQIHTGTDFRDIHWRFYMKLQEGFSGYPSKSTRITSFAGTNWSQAMIAHIWSYSVNSPYLSIDPASGVNSSGTVVTTKYNDFNNLTWLGKTRAAHPLPVGEWYCVEGHVKLNTPGSKNGVFELRVNDTLEARRTDYDFVKTWTSYGLNALSFENYWNGGSAKAQDRYMDALVVSTKPIGCIDAASPPKAPELLDVE